MKPAFLIAVHKNPEQLQKLVDFLVEGGGDVYVHIDKKWVNSFSEFILRNTGRIHIYSEFNVHWGGYSQIKTTLFLLKKALESKSDFFILISGQDIPVKTMREFREFLEKNRAHSFFEFTRMPAPQWGLNGGLDRVGLLWIEHYPPRWSWYFWRLQRLIHKIQEKTGWRLTLRIPPYGGANWFNLNREMAEYVMDYVKKKPGYKRRFKFSRLADEIFVQTILMNSPHAQQVVNRSLRYIDWNSGPEYPRMLRDEDFERMFSIDDAFFARKIDMTTEPLLVDKVYAHLAKMK
jgi:hypothetical protein